MDEVSTLRSKHGVLYKVNINIIIKIIYILYCYLCIFVLKVYAYSFGLNIFVKKIMPLNSVVVE